MNAITGRIQSIKTEENGNAIIIVDSTSTGGLPSTGSDGHLIIAFIILVV